MCEGAIVATSVLFYFNFFFFGVLESRKIPRFKTRRVFIFFTEMST